MTWITKWCYHFRFTAKEAFIRDFPVFLIFKFPRIFHFPLISYSSHSKMFCSFFKLFLHHQVRHLIAVLYSRNHHYCATLISARRWTFSSLRRLPIRFCCYCYTFLFSFLFIKRNEEKKKNFFFCLMLLLSSRAYKFFFVVRRSLNIHFKLCIEHSEFRFIVLTVTIIICGLVLFFLFFFFIRA